MGKTETWRYPGNVFEGFLYGNNHLTRVFGTFAYSTENSEKGRTASFGSRQLRPIFEREIGLLPGFLWEENRKEICRIADGQENVLF